MPFAFEGSRCQRQAILGLARLRQEADAVIRVSNQHVLKLGDGKMPAVQLFATANARLGEAVRGIARLLVLPGLVNLDFGALRNILAGNRSECCLAAAEAEGDNRAFEVWEKLGQSPDFSEPASLAGAEQVLVSIVGGEDLIAADFEWIISQVGSRAPQARIVFGAVVDPTFAGRLAVTLIASRYGEVAEESPVAAVAVKPAAQPAADDSRNELAAQFLSPTPSVSRPRSRFVAPAPVVSPDKAQQMYRRQAGRSRRKKDAGTQGLLPLEIVSKGRFEKCESTVYDGEDLDVPTYIRRGIILVESGN
jgi:cell division protein FtsZ